MVTKEQFGITKDGKEVSIFTLTNRAGMKVSAISYGAFITGICTADRNGNFADVTLGFRTLGEYEENGGSVGASVGRYANRIGGAKFTLNGVEYLLDKNDGENSLHGGFNGWSQRVWDAKELPEENGVAFSLTSPDMDQGCPGEMKTTVKYTLGEDNALHIFYYGLSDKDTVYNPTNHTYFNLSGKQGGEDVLDHYVILNSTFFTPVFDAASIPTGEMRKVEGTPMDFRKGKKLGEDIGTDYEQVIYGNGFDHNWMLDGEGMKLCAVCWEEKSGRRFTAYTDMPAVQMYTGNFLDGTFTDKLGQKILRRTGVCFETQLPPDAVNKPNFPSPVIKAGVPFTSETVYRFDCV